MPEGPGGGRARAALTVLGAGTLVPDATRHSAAHHVDTGDARILFDCGPGTLHGFDAHGVQWQDLTHVVVSHYHNDHVGDLAAILFAMSHAVQSGRTAPLTLVGPSGFGDFLSRLAGVMGDHVLRPGFEVDVVEVGAGQGLEDPALGARLTAHPTPHTTESVAYRLEGDWGSLGYTGDTGPAPDLGTFLAGCGVIIAECAWTDPHETGTHLSPRGLAEIASIARPELLLVTHVYPPQTPAEAVASVSALYDGAVVAGEDGLRVTFTPGGLTVDPPARPPYTSYM